jgi:hypothetical protein
MAWPPVAADLYRHGAPSGFFDGVQAATITAALSASLGECGRALSPRVGGAPEDWTFTSAAGQEEATRDVCQVAAGELAFSLGLVLPVQQTVDGDRTFNDRVRAVRERWRRMGTPGGKDPSKAEPLYAGLVDATPSVTEGKARGWSTPFSEVNDEVEA